MPGKREIFKRNCFEHFCCYNNEKQLFVCYLFSMAVKKFSCHNNFLYIIPYVISA